MEEKITAAEMGRRDRNTAWWGIPTELLMENAGRAVAEKILLDHSNLGELGVCILCGTGNNGGDGFVAARLLAGQAAFVTVVLMGDPSQLSTGLAASNWQRLRNLTHSIQTRVCRTPDQLAIIEAEIKKAKIIVDALLGTGIRGKVREPVASAIRLINLLSGDHFSKYAVDIPSGMDPDTGDVIDIATQVDVVVTFHRAKTGMELSGKSPYYKELVVRGIGIPPEAINFVGPGDLARFYRPRPENAHKGNFGKVLVVGGSDQYSGAPALAALSALRGGCDLVTCAIPEIIVPVVRGYSPGLIVQSLSGTHIAPKHGKKLTKLLQWADSVLIGPGGSEDEEALEGMARVITDAVSLKKAVVVDADGLKALKNLSMDFSGIPMVITPHAGEFQGLFGDNLYSSSLEEKIARVKKWANKKKMTVLLKGSVDVISDGTLTRLNKTGTPAMTVGGTGDVLSGLVTALLARRIPLPHAAILAAFINGLAGELAEAENGPNLLPTDLLDHIPKVIRDFSS